MRNSNGGRDNRKSNRDQYRKPDYAGEMLTTKKTMMMTLIMMSLTI